METLEQGMREAALRDGSKALSKLLSEIPEYNGGDIQCLECCKPMSNLGRREKEIKSLLGDGIISRMYYECTDADCKEHRFPKDELLDIEGTMFSPGI